MKHNITIFLSFFTFVWLFSSCNTTKYVPEGKMLLKKNEVIVEGSGKYKTNLLPYLLQQTNSNPLSLWFYNLASKDYEKKWNQKILKYYRTNSLFTRIFSLKQAIGWANFRKNINKWILENGDKPVLLDEKKIKKSVENLKRYYINEGFFKARIRYDIDTLEPKKARVRYLIQPGQAFVIDSVMTEIESPIIDSLYTEHRGNSLIKAGKIYKSIDFENEALRLTRLFRNAGVYHFNKYAISFWKIDSTASNNRTPVLMKISDRLLEKDDSIIHVPFQITRIENVVVYTDYSYLNRERPIRDSIKSDSITFYAYNKINYKPHLLLQSIYIKPGHKYSDINTEKTRKSLRDLGSFKSIRIHYIEQANHMLKAVIQLTPVKQYTVKLEAEATHNNIKPFAFSGIFSLSNKNTLKRNEILQLGLQGSFINVAKNDEDTQKSNFFNALELGFDLSYKIPRFLLPWKGNNNFLHEFSPVTQLTLGTSFQKNIGLDKQRFTSIFQYKWKSSPKLSHTTEIINAQFIKNLNVNSFFDVYSSEYRKLQEIQQNNSDLFDVSELNDPKTFMDNALANTALQQNTADYLKLRNIKKRYNIITEDILIPMITYQIIYNTQINYSDHNFSYIRARIGSAGLFSSLLASQRNEEGIKQIFGTNIAQYIKLDLEYRKHWHFNGDNVLAFRFNLGVAKPYGNAISIPFSRSYFAGGPNDIRAWHIYELGPGFENSGLEFNVGNFKLLGNLEYRFNVIGSFKMALFVDAGNIWDLTHSDLSSDLAKFKGFSSLESTALGSGLGVRYDFSFLVLRVDLGFKTYEPYNAAGERWFRNYNLSHSVMNFGINYPF